MTPWLLCVALVFWGSWDGVCTEPLGISHWDLEGANRTCYGRSTCETKGRVTSRVGGDDLDWRERNCFCDALCAQYGDCCVDSPHFVAAQQRRSSAIFSCVDLRQFGGIYMKTSCPPNWEDAQVRLQCEREDTDQSDPLSALPVTSRTSGYTYRNAHCALCHADLDLAGDPWARADLWRPRVECPTLHHHTRDDLSAKLRYEAERRAWGVWTRGAPAGAPGPAPGGNSTATNTTSAPEHFHVCQVDPVMPDTSADKVRRCQADTVRTCAVNWTNTEVRTRCEAYTSYVYQGQTPFRNPHCAICNNVGLQFLQCQKVLTRTIFQGKDFSPVAFAVLFDLMGTYGGSTVGKMKACPPSQLFDPFFRRCRSVLCPVAGQDWTGGRCSNGSVVNWTHTTTPRNYRGSTQLYDGNTPDNSSGLVVDEDQSLATAAAEANFRTCPKFLLEVGEFMVAPDNLSVSVAAYGITFTAGQFRLRPEDGRLEICADSLGVEWVDKFGPYMGYVTFAGLGVSVVFLLLHLTAFALVPELRNLSGKNLASLCLSLLVAYLCFIAGQLMGSEAGVSCRVVAVITYYSFLASFSWMLTMALDVWRSLRLATCELRVSVGKQWRKFLLYSLWSWLMPAAIVLAALLVDVAPDGAVDDHFRPGFGLHACWFAWRPALLVFFAAPLAVIMLLNVLLFASSALMIVRTAPSIRYAPPPGGPSGTRRDFRLYIRLALVMGLTWTVGLVAGCLDMEALWYAFVALNSLQGLFIFLAFTCTERVVRGLGLGGLGSGLGVVRSLSRRRSADGKPIRPPSFSWSGGSADSTHKSALGSSSESSSHRGVPAVNGHHQQHPADTLY